MATDGAVPDRAAGAVVHRKGPAGPEILVVHRPRYDDWTLPKGHLDDAETWEEAARREVEEETGISGALAAEIGAVGYTVDGAPKAVRYWLMDAEDGEFRPNREADAARWVTADDLDDSLSWRRDRNVAAAGLRLLDHPSTGRIHLVRHGHAGARMRWRGPDDERPLSDKGARETDAITSHLLEQPVTTIHSSPYVRCTQTVQPLAEALDEDVRHEPALAEGTAPEESRAFIEGLAGQSAVLCTHGDVVSGVVGLLAADGVPLHGPLEWRKGSIWELDLDDGRITSGRYRPPPRVG